MAPPSEAELAAARASGSGRAALGPLPAGYPAPRSRVVLRDVNVRVSPVAVAMCWMPVTLQKLSSCRHIANTIMRVYLVPLCRPVAPSMTVDF